MLDFVALEEKLQTENESLKSAIVAVKKELQTEKDSIFVETKSGSIRKLYYTLLANQVPAALPQESEILYQQFESVFSWTVISQASSYQSTRIVSTNQTCKAAIPFEF